MVGAARLKGCGLMLLRLITNYTHAGLCSTLETSVYSDPAWQRVDSRRPF